VRGLLPPRSELERRHLAAARDRLARLDFHPRPVRMRWVRIVHAPWFFRLPWLRRFAGYEFGPLILIARPLAEVSNDLITHELCHVWQDQDHRLRMWLSYLVKGYARNPHELEARRAAARR
jgi:hypothetical protein